MNLYYEVGLSGHVEGPNDELAGMEQILEHWRDLDHREPTLKIVCPYDYDFSRNQHGLFPDGCPNLLWELMRTRRKLSSASQLTRKNPTEAIVDKDNHLRDALKYIILSLPSPSEIQAKLTWEQIVKEAFANGTEGTLAVRMAQFEPKERANLEPIYYRAGSLWRSIREWDFCDRCIADGLVTCATSFV